MVQAPPGGWIQKRYRGLGQEGLTEPVRSTAAPVAADAGGVAVKPAPPHALTMLKDRTTVPEATKIWPPASLGVEKRLMLKLAL